MDRIGKIKKQHKINEKAELNEEYNRIAKVIIKYVLNKPPKTNAAGRRFYSFKLTEIMDVIGMDNSTNRRKRLGLELEKRGFRNYSVDWFIPET